MGTATVCNLTMEEVRRVLAERCGGVILSGAHSLPPNEEEPCRVCVRELRALACGLEFNDHPDNPNGSATPTDRGAQSLNDAEWSSNAVRTRHCAPLALLSESTAPEGWLKAMAEQTIRQIVPIALRAAASVHPEQAHRDSLLAAALLCEAEGTESAAESARSAAKSAESARSAARDSVMALAVNIMLTVHGRPEECVPYSAGGANE